ncbi:MAG: DUF1194 domain-containing protein [Geminicoccaceae bacterium]
MRPIVLALLPLLTAAVPAAALPVDLELVLAVDVSGSMDQGEQALQRRGYVEALLHPEVGAAIRSGPYGRIAATYVEWAGPGLQRVTVPWALLETAADTEDFAAGLSEAPPARFRGTSISGALAYAARLFEGNGFEGLRRVIDVSGDGANNAGPPVTGARDAVLGEGIVVNGLPIQIDVPLYQAFGGSELATYYRDCVVGGPGAFVLPVIAPDQLLESIRRKLVLEIAADTPLIVPVAAGNTAGATDCMIGERLRRTWEREP